MQLNQFVSLHLHTEHHALLMLSDIYVDHQTNHLTGPIAIMINSWVSLVQQLALWDI